MSRLGPKHLPVTEIPTAAGHAKPEEAVRTKPVISPAASADVPQPAKHRIEISAQPEVTPPSWDKRKPRQAEEPASHVVSKPRLPQVAERPTRSDTPTEPAAEPKTEPKTELKTEPKVAPAAAPVEDFGMNLQRPATRRPTNKIDETDPYAQ